jgi:hypothetical protein
LARGFFTVAPAEEAWIVGVMATRTKNANARRRMRRAAASHIALLGSAVWAEARSLKRGS